MKNNLLRNLFAGLVILLVFIGVIYYFRQSSINNNPAPNAVSPSSVSNNLDRTPTPSISSISSQSPSATISSPTPTTSPTVKSDIVIQYIHGAFSPSTANISVGQTVSFINNDTTAVNVDSDPYPENTGFLPLNIGIINPGKTGSTISFPKAGTYGYHNHINPDQHGTIVVK